MDFWSRIEQVRARWNVLEHPFYERWSRGELGAFYGIDGGPATAYFDLHAELDREHAALERALIEPLLAGADEDALLAEAEAVLRANWELLDGVERRRAG